jgi:hypothetical protein
VASKQLSKERLKLITKPSQEIRRATKLKSNLLILAGLTSERRQLRTKSVNLTPNNRELIEESINYIITLAKKLLLTNSSKKSRLSCGLIATTKKCPHLMRPLKLYNHNNNNQAFYSQASWGRLEMKPYDPKKTGTKQERKRRGKTKGDKKNQTKKRRKDNKTLSQKSEKRAGKKPDKRQ